MKANSKSRGAELLSDLAQHIAVDLRERLALEPSEAEEIGAHVAKRMAGHWGGQNIYFPMGLSAQLFKRDQQIYQEFNGVNHGELARKYHVSLQWIYKIVKAVQRERAKRSASD